MGLLDPEQRQPRPGLSDVLCTAKLTVLDSQADSQVGQGAPGELFLQVEGKTNELCFHKIKCL